MLTQLFLRKDKMFNVNEAQKRRPLIVSLIYEEPHPAGICMEYWVCARSCRVAATQKHNWNEWHGAKLSHISRKYCLGPQEPATRAATLVASRGWAPPCLHIWILQMNVGWTQQVGAYVPDICMLLANVKIKRDINFWKYFVFFVHRIINNAEICRKAKYSRVRS